MITIDLFPSEVTTDEAGAGFAVCQVEHPDGAAATVPAVVHTWGDPSHRLVKTRGRDGQVVFQLQAFGRPRVGAGTGPLGWTAERYWPGGYGPAWVLDRVREHVGRPEYSALIELHVPPGGVDELAPAAGPAT